MLQTQHGRKGVILFHTLIAHQQLLQRFIKFKRHHNLELVRLNLDLIILLLVLVALLKAQ